MCEKGCNGCRLVRFVKPQDSDRSFCVTKEEAVEVHSDINKVNFYVHMTDTREEAVTVCDHPNDFKPKTN